MIKKDRPLLIIMIVGLSLMLMARDIWGVSMNKFLYLAFAVVCMVLVNYRTLVSMICFILPLVCGLPGTYIMPVAALLLIFKRGKVRLTSIFLVVCLSILEIVASFWYPKVDVPLITQYISFMAVMILMIHNSADVDYEQGVRMYLYGVLLLCAVITIATLKDAPSNWLDRFARGAFRFGAVDFTEESGMALTLNANSLAYYSLTGITCGIFMASRRKGMARIIYIAIAVFTALAGFFTVSRSWLLFSALCLFLYICSNLRSPRQFLAMAGIVAVMAIGAFIWLQNNPQLLNGFIARLTADDIETGNNRTLLFRVYMDYFFGDIRYMLFGTGVVSYRSVLIAEGSIHNGTQQILVCTGLVGFALYMFALIGPLLRVKKQRKENITRWLPLLGIVLFIQTIQFLNPTMLMLPYVVGVFALRADDKPMYRQELRGKNLQ